MHTLFRFPSAVQPGGGSLWLPFAVRAGLSGRKMENTKEKDKIKRPPAPYSCSAEAM